MKSLAYHSFIRLILHCSNKEDVKHVVNVICSEDERKVIPGRKCFMTPGKAAALVIMNLGQG